MSVEGIIFGPYVLAQIARFAVVLLASAGLILWGVTRRSTAAWCALCVLVVVDLGIFAQKFTPEAPTEYLDVDLAVVNTMQSDPGPVRMCAIGPGGADFMNRMSPNVPMLFDLQDIQGSESLIYGRYQRFLKGICDDRFGFPQPDPALPALDLLGVKHLLTSLRIEETGWRLEQSYETRLYVNEDALPRAFIARAVRVHHSEQELLDLVTGSDLDPWVIHLLRRDAPAAGSQPGVAGSSTTVGFTDYGPNCVEVSGDFRAGQWLVLSDVLYPGWRAYVDGAEEAIVPADYVLRAVHLARAAKAVSFVYLPASFQLGAFASLLALAALAALASATLLRPCPASGGIPPSPAQGLPCVRSASAPLGGRGVGLLLPPARGEEGRGRGE